MAALLLTAFTARRSSVPFTAGLATPLVATGSKLPPVWAQGSRSATVRVYSSTVCQTSCEPVERCRTVPDQLSDLLLILPCPYWMT